MQDAEKDSGRPLQSQKNILHILPLRSSDHAYLVFPIFLRIRSFS
jgi:hypothetical protein